MKTAPTGTYVPSTPPMRPGSQDAFKKPSLVSGKHVDYKPPVSGCVGVLKDRRQHNNNY